MSAFELSTLSAQGQEYFNRLKALHPDRYDGFVAAFIEFQEKRFVRFRAKELCNDFICPYRQ